MHAENFLGWGHSFQTSSTRVTLFFCMAYHHHQLYKPPTKMSFVTQLSICFSPSAQISLPFPPFRTPFDIMGTLRSIIQPTSVVLLVALLSVAFTGGRASRLNRWELEIKMPTEKDVAEGDEELGTRWAVLVAGSQGYGNYRHQVRGLIQPHTLISPKITQIGCVFYLCKRKFNYLFMEYG